VYAKILSIPNAPLYYVTPIATFERKGEYIWFPFLEPEDINILSLGAIWNFGKGTGLSWADIRLWGTKGPVYKA